jgi:ribosomal protein S12 methylthiotransferase accessory factor
MQLRSRATSKPQDTIDRLPWLMDGPAKIIDRVEWYALRPTDPVFFHAHAHMTDLTSRTTGWPPLVPVTGGSALDGEQALAKSIGEAVERHCASFYDPAGVAYAAYADIRGHAVNPADFVLWSADQYATPGFPFPRPDERAVIGWVPAWSLKRQAPVYVPASLVHVTYQPAVPGEVFEIAPVSGYAAGITPEEAVLGALLEVVERDAFMIFWRNRLTVPGYDLASFRDGAVHETLSRYATAPVRLFCSRLTTDIGIPVSFAVMVGAHPSLPAAMIGASANLDEERAIAKAFQESAMVHLLTRTLHETRGPWRPRRSEEVLTQEDHALFFASRERLPLLDPVLRPRSRVARDGLEKEGGADDVKAQIDTCVARLAAAGLEAFIVDITLPAMKRLGFTVVKALIPGAQPLDFGSHHPHLGGRRLFEAPVRMKYRPAPASVGELNFEPHPFP